MTRHHRVFALAAAALAAAVGSAVVGGAFAAAPPAGPKLTISKKGDVKKGRETFQTMCSPCHGPNGHGDGPSAAALDPKPRNLARPGYVASLSDEHIVKLLKGGGAAVGLSPLMPPLGAAMTEQQLADVIAYVRTLAPAASDGKANAKAGDAATTTRR